MGRYRLTVDTGGTFSDFVYLDEDTSEVTIAKLPSTPDDPSRAITEGVVQGLANAARAMAADVTYFGHGTTVATNALLERKGERTALLRAALLALIERESARRLAVLGGTEPDLAAPERRRVL